MAEPLGSSIQTQITEGPTLVSQMNENTQTLQSIVPVVPQIQTVLTDGVVNISSLINAPFVEVTSINGMTGDVIVEPIMGDFQANHYYLKNTIINHENKIYWSKNTFTSGSSFSEADWNSIEVNVEVSTDWLDITNKPDFATVATSGDYGDLSNTPSLSSVAISGSYEDLSNKPTIPVVNDGTLTIQKNGTTVNTFTANSGSDSIVNISVPTQTSDLTNDSNFFSAIASTVDIGEGSGLAANTLYLVYEDL